MSFPYKNALFLVPLLAASPAFALSVNPAFQLAGPTASATFESQSTATLDSLTIGLYDASGQRAVLFDNTSPPTNPNGLGPVGAGATAALATDPSGLTIDVTNTDPTGFELGFGNTSTLYT